MRLSKSSAKINHQIIIQMKKLLTFLISFMIIGNLFSQENKINVTPDPRVIEVFGQETVDFYLQNNPKLILYYNYFFDHSYQITEIPQEKIKELKDIQELKLKPQYQMESVDYTENGLKNLNIMKFDFNLNFEINTFFRLGNTNKIIVFLSGKDIQNQFNQSVK
jgi:hypothetical protein